MSISLFISNSCSLIFSKSVAVVNVVKSLVFETVVTLGYQLLSRHFRILMFSSSLSKCLPSLIRWLTMWVNRFCTSIIVSPFYIQNNSYSWIKACFLALFTSVVPSWVTSSISHISYVELHCDTLKNSSRFKTKIIIFLTMQTYCTFLFSTSISLSKDFSTFTPFTTAIGTNGPFTIAFQIPR